MSTYIAGRADRPTKTNVPILIHVETGRFAPFRDDKSRNRWLPGGEFAQKNLDPNEWLVFVDTSSGLGAYFNVRPD